MDDQQAVLLTVLDLSTAFDTVDHEILFRCLECEFGVCDDALTWIHSYLNDRNQSVMIYGIRSQARCLGCGPPPLKSH